MAIPILKLVQRGGFLAGFDGNKNWVSFKYERLPMFCHHCGLLGHDLKHCASYFAATNNKKDVVCQYGEWLKASGGRQMAKGGKDFRADQEVDEGSRSSIGQGVAAEEQNKENPRDHEEAEKGDGGNPGTVTDCVINVPEIMEGIDMVMEGKDSDCMGNSSQNLIHINIGVKGGDGVHVQSNVTKEGKVNVENRECDGPKNLKNKPTWTRLACMVDGQDVLTQQSSVKLGKRGLSQWDEQSITEEEGHTRKHEKLHGGETEKRAVGVRDHPRRAQ